MTQREPSSPAETHRIDPDAIEVDAVKVLRRLSRHGFDAYLVGGCVRDLLVGRPPKDFDVATNARPRQIKRLFRNSRIIGRRFRLVHVRFGPHIIEVSTFRAPPPPQEGDDPLVSRDNVFGTQEQDAFRRDFTINGLFYDIARRRVIDHVDGLRDLEERRIRTIGDPERRVREDPVRILRAARFAGRLDFELDPGLRDAACTHAADLTRSAPPRVLEEIFRLLDGHGAAPSWRILDEVGAVDVLLPEVAPLPPFFFEALERLERLGGGRRDPAPRSLLLAVLLAPYVKPALLDGQAHDYEAKVSELIRPVSLRLTVARRDQSVARQCLAAQPRFLREPHGRGARRLTRRDFFAEALTLRRLLGPMSAVEPDPLPAWETLTDEERRDRGPRRRRKRRGRRGGRRKRALRAKAAAGKDGACPSPPASSSAPVPPPPSSGSPPGSSSGGSLPA
ncbi:MAG: polynucleotide adenylyltransferase PcnB [Planctomycetota bacterium]|jgi:poly(A) polymerase